jgi:hypothetical protein
MFRVLADVRPVGVKYFRKDAFYSVAATFCSVGRGKNWEGGSVRWIMDLKKGVDRKEVVFGKWGRALQKRANY